MEIPEHPLYELVTPTPNVSDHLRRKAECEELKEIAIQSADDNLNISVEDKRFISSELEKLKKETRLGNHVIHNPEDIISLLMGLGLKEQKYHDWATKCFKESLDTDARQLDIIRSHKDLFVYGKIAVVVLIGTALIGFIAIFSGSINHLIINGEFRPQVFGNSGSSRSNASGTNLSITNSSSANNASTGT